MESERTVQLHVMKRAVPGRSHVGNAMMYYVPRVAIQKLEKFALVVNQIDIFSRQIARVLRLIMNMTQV